MSRDLKLKPGVPKWHPNGHYAAYFFDPIYKASVHVIWPCTKDQSNAYCDMQLEQANRRVKEAAAGSCYDIEADSGVKLNVIALAQWPSNRRMLETLCHESFHCAEFIMQRVAISHCDETSEAWAYLLDSIFGRCLDILAKEPPRNPDPSPKQGEAPSTSSPTGGASQPA